MTTKKELTLTQKLCYIQGRLNAPKSQTNAFGKYKYRSCEDILEALKPLLTEHGCVITFQDLLERIGDRYYINALATIDDGNDKLTCTAYAREPAWEDVKGAGAAQVTGSTSSYARKYALNALFAIDDCKDADTVDNRSQPKQDEPQKPEANTFIQDQAKQWDKEVKPEVPQYEREPDEPNDGQYVKGAIYKFVGDALGKICKDKGMKRADITNWIKSQYNGDTLAKMQNDDNKLLDVLKRFKSEYAPTVGDSVNVGGAIAGTVVKVEE